MKFIVYNESVPPGSPDALTDATLPGAGPAGYDLVVEVHSVPVNPVDTTIRGGLLLPPVVPGTGQGCVRRRMRRLFGINMASSEEKSGAATRKCYRHFYSIII